MDENEIDFFPCPQGFEAIDAFLLEIGLEADLINADKNWRDVWKETIEWIKGLYILDESLFFEERGNITIFYDEKGDQSLVVSLWDEYALTREESHETTPTSVKPLILVRNNKSLIWWLKQYLPTIPAFASLVFD